MTALHGKHLFWFSKAPNYTTQGDHKKGFQPKLWLRVNLKIRFLCWKLTQVASETTRQT